MKLALDKQAAKKTPLLKIFRKVNPNTSASASQPHDEMDKSAYPAKKERKASASAVKKDEQGSRGDEEMLRDDDHASRQSCNEAASAIKDSTPSAMQGGDSSLARLEQNVAHDRCRSNACSDGSSMSNCAKTSCAVTGESEKPASIISVQKVAPDALPHNRKRKSHVVALTALDLTSPATHVKSSRIMAPSHSQTPCRPLLPPLDNEDEESASSKVAIANALLFLSN